MFKRQRIYFHNPLLRLWIVSLPSVLCSFCFYHSKKHTLKYTPSVGTHWSSSYWLHHSSQSVHWHFCLRMRMWQALENMITRHCGFACSLSSTELSSTCQRPVSGVMRLFYRFLWLPSEKYGINILFILCWIFSRSVEAREMNYVDRRCWIDRQQQNFQLGWSSTTSLQGSAN